MKKKKFQSKFPNTSKLIIAVAVIVMVIILLVPLPTVLLDIMIAINLILTFFVFFIVLRTKRAMDFSSFPILLLLFAVYGQGINVISTRIILIKGADFDGRIIRAVATFITSAGDNKELAQNSFVLTEGFVVGFVIFFVVIAVLTMVITNGATRIAEVAARFALDAQPGKQMAIEAEVNTDSLSEEESIARKNDLQREVDFYGAMDGASKFISGNVKTGIFITAIIILGGIFIDVLIRAKTLGEAAGTYIFFAVGNGIVFLFPAFFLSTAAGIIVTRDKTLIRE